MLFEVSFVNVQVADVKDKLETLRASLVEAEAELASTTARLTVAEKALGKAKRQRLQQDTAFGAKLKEHVKINPSLIELRKQAEHLSKKIARSRDKQAQLQREHDTQREELAALEQQQFDLQQARKEWEAQVARQQAESKSVALDDEQLEQYNVLKEKAALAAMQQRHLLADLQTRQLLTREELEALEAKQQALTRRRADLEQDQRAVAARLAHQQTVAEEARAQMAELEAQRAAHEARREAALRERDQLTEALQTMQEQLRDEKMDRKQSEREARFQQSLEAMTRLYSGVRGRLMDLAEPRQRKYQAAASVAMGRHMEAIVVDTRATAVECLQYLKSQRVGVATFLPLDSIQASPVQERLRALGGSAKLVCDVLTYDKELEKAVLYAVGSAVVCDTDAEAKELCYGRERLKTITLAGTVYHKSGVVSGGAASSAAKWTRAKLEALKKRRDEHVAQLDRIAHELRAQSNAEDTQSALASLSVRQRAAQVELAQCEAKLGVVNAELATVDRELAALQPQIQGARTAAQAADALVRSGEDDVRAREASVFADWCRRVGVASVAQYEAEAVSVAHQRNERRLQFAAQEARLTAALNYGRSRDVDAASRSAAEAARADEQQLATVQKELAKLAKQEDGLLKQLEALKAKVLELKAAEADADAEARQVRAARQERTTAVGERSNAVAAAESALRALQSRRHAVLRRAAVDEVHLPTDGGPMEVEEDGGGGEQFREAQSSQSQVEVFDEEDRLQFDLSDLRAELRSVHTEAEFNRLLGEMQTELASITMQLSRMNPNLKAVDKLREVKGKIAEIDAGLKDARRQGQTVAQRFQEVRDERLKLFMDCFQHVSEQIERVYDNLTRATVRDPVTASGGGSVSGKAFLTLQDLHEPWSAGITYQAIPPQKRMWNYEQLSGGERSLASLALIFAIQSFKPAPFFVLDEIDAALDEGNVKLLTRFIQEHAASCQFIIISLKDTFFAQADALVGVYKDNAGECSRSLSLDLRNRVYTAPLVN